MNEVNDMKRTGEKVLIVIASIFNVIAIIFTAILMAGAKAVIGDSNFAQKVYDSLVETAEPGVEQLNVDEIQEMLDLAAPYINTFGVTAMVVALIGLILGIVAYVFINKNKKMSTAGALLIVAGVLSGGISLTSILYYIAAILCFVRKEPPVVLEKPLDLEQQ